MPDDDLLSRGKAPHYHRRCTVSLLSSEWIQVVPVLYGRQANWLWRHPVMMEHSRNVCKCLTVLYQAVSRTPVCLINRSINRFYFPIKSGTIAHYMVKPHGQLVPVSLTHCCASTPGLSTLSSSTALQGAQGSREISSWKRLPA